MARIQVIFLFFTAFLFNSCWRQILGDHNLGDNFSLLLGDDLEENSIVYCTNYDLGACNGGINVVPAYSRKVDSKGNYIEYVETAKSDGDWIIAKTLQLTDNHENYWIVSKDFNLDLCGGINCDSLVQAHVFGPFEQAAF